MTERLSQQVTLVNELGMHLRAAGRFVQVASRFKAAITIERKEVAVDGRSIMGILSLAAACGQEITIHAEGEDAADTLMALVALVQDSFEEGR